MPESVYTLIVCTPDEGEPTVTVAHQGRFLGDMDALGVLVVVESCLRRRLRWRLPGGES